MSTLLPVSAGGSGAGSSRSHALSQRTTHGRGAQVVTSHAPTAPTGINSCRRSRHFGIRSGASGFPSTSDRTSQIRGAQCSTNAKSDDFEMDLVWDQSHPKYLQFAGGSVDDSDSSDDEDEKVEKEIINEERKTSPDDVRGSIASVAAAAAASRRRGSTPSTWEESKLQRRLGGVGGGEESQSSINLGSAWDPIEADLNDQKKVNPKDTQSGYEWSDGDPVWDIICTLAKKDAASEPLLSSYMYMSILSHDTLEQAVSFVLANRLADSTLLPTQLMEIFNSVLFADDDEGVFVRSALRKDIRAIRERDPACSSYVHALLYLKGFHALQAHRVQHALWNRGQKLLALTLQARISTVFAVDLHPAAKLGKGILIDHGTGVVIGETAVVGDNVSILQGTSYFLFIP